MMARIIIILLPIALLPLGLLAMIEGPSRRRRKVMLSSSRKPPALANITEALVLLVVSAAFLVEAGFNRRLDGDLLRLGEFTPDFARIHLLVFAGAVVMLLVAAALSLRGRTSTGVILAAGCLSAYAFFGHMPSTFRQARVSGAGKEDQIGIHAYAFDRERPGAGPLEGDVAADVWINGIYLGQTPIRMGIDEFSARVPDWSDPPEGIEGEAEGIPNYTPWGISHLPAMERCLFDPSRAPRNGSFYARVECAGEPGLIARHYNYFDTSPGHPLQWIFRMDVYFPGREDRLERLTEQLRARDYAATPAWLDALETFGSDGWQGLTEAAEADPRMGAGLEAWAARYRGGTDIIDAASAWEALEVVLRKVDEEGSYQSGSLAEHAIKQIAPFLDPDQLADRLETMLARATRGQHFLEVHGDDLRWQPPQTSQPSRIWTSIPGLRSRRHLPPSGAALLDAAWAVDRRLDAAGASEPNPVESRIVPVLLRNAYPNFPENTLRYLVELGGADLARFVDRKWQITASQLTYRDEIRFGGSEGINKWLYYSAMLPNAERDAGENAAQDGRHDALMRAARTIASSNASLSMRWDDRLDVLFVDLNRGKESAAYRFFHQYRQLVSRHDEEEALAAEWRYLVRMESVSTLEMYLTCWREAKVEPNDQSFGILQELPKERRSALIDALQEEVRRDPSNLVVNQERGETVEEVQAVVIGRLEYWRAPRENEARALLDQLAEGGTGIKPETVALWLAHEEPDHPLVAMLLEHPDPALRKAAIPALQTHPTPENRALLARLLEDPDEGVRAAAAEAHQVVAELIATPSEALVSVPGPR